MTAFDWSAPGEILEWGDVLATLSRGACDWTPRQWVFTPATPPAPAVPEETA